MLPGNARAEPNIATAGGILPSISKPSTNSAMMRKMRQVSLLVKSSMTYCSSTPFFFMMRIPNSVGDKKNGVEEQYVIDDFTSKDTWRIFRIMAEFVEGFEMLGKIPPAVAMFGSARALPGSIAYDSAQAIATILGKNGYSVITGGGRSEEH